MCWLNQDPWQDCDEDPWQLSIDAAAPDRFSDPWQDDVDPWQDAADPWQPFVAEVGVSSRQETAQEEAGNDPWQPVVSQVVRASGTVPSRDSFEDPWQPAFADPWQEGAEDPWQLP